MKNVKEILIFFVLILTFCNLKSPKVNINDNLDNSSEPSYYEYKSQIIDKFNYIFFIRDNGEFNIQNSKNEIIYSQNKNVTNFELIDFDEDGFNDVIISHPSNRVLQTLLLYKSDLKTFVLIDDFIDFPNSKKIDSINFYYSYQGNGCAQNDWSSFLYKIKGRKIIKLGLIDGNGCLKNDKNGIYIYNIKSENQVFLKYINRDEGFWKDKLDFIDNYWNKNYNLFKD